MRLGKKGNLAFRNRLGISTNNNSPFAPFVFDSFVNIRGIGNRVARGTAEFILNAEYRLSVFQNKYLILQLTTFTDFGALRAPGSSLQTMLNGSKSNFFIGGGVRLHSRLIYKTIFRLDYSINPVNLNKGGFTFGLGQYF